MALRRSLRAQSVLSQGSAIIEKITEDHLSSKSAQSTVTCIYQANVAGCWRNVTFLWCKNLMNHSLNLTIDGIGAEFHYNCKIDVKPWHFWSKKGYKTFDVDGHQVEVYWDLRSAKFSGSPEPSSDFYVALVSDDEVVLLLGDYKKKAYKRTKSKPAFVEAMLLVKKENVFAKKSFSTKARFDGKRKDSEIVVESSTYGPGDPEMWISIDGIVAIHVKNLQWKFRGNQTVVVNKQTLQVFWDVHDWLFNGPCHGPGLFMFKPGPPEAEGSEKEVSSQEFDSDGESSGFHSTLSTNPSGLDFCLVLCAYKLE